jgi:hypothetical protein
VLGVIILSIVGGASRLDVCWPHGPDASGALCVGLGVTPPFLDVSSAIVRAVASCALTLGPYLWWRRRAELPSPSRDG